MRRPGSNRLARERSQSQARRSEVLLEAHRSVTDLVVRHRVRQHKRLIQMSTRFRFQCGGTRTPFVHLASFAWRMTHGLLLSAILIYGFSGCGTSEAVRAKADVPEWSRTAIWYQIFVERFRNGDLTNDPMAHDIELADPGPARRLEHESVDERLVSPGTVGCPNRSGFLQHHSEQEIRRRSSGCH